MSTSFAHHEAPPKAPHEAPPEGRALAPDAATKKARVVLITRVEDLESHRAGWELLAKEAIEPNVFYEAFVLIPALRAFAGECTLVLAFVERHDGSLIGFFPFVRVRRYRGFPISALALWEHDYCPLGTPLVHAAHGDECMKALFDWFADCDAPLVELTNVAGDGPFQHLLVNAMNTRETLFFPIAWHTRGLLLSRASADAYLTDALRADGRRKIKAKEKKLGQAGTVEYVELSEGGDAAAWAREFMEVEARGWKGKNGTAFASKEIDRAFCQTLAEEAAKRGRLMALSLRVNGRPVALKFNLLGAKEGSFAFKITYDEDFASASPGMLLEIENIRRLHDRPSVRWMDSCAHPLSRVFTELWPERRTIETLVIANEAAGGELFVSMMPLLRWVKTKIRHARAKLRAARGTRPATTPD